VFKKIIIYSQSKEFVKLVNDALPRNTPVLFINNCQNLLQNVRESDSNLVLADLDLYRKSENLQLLKNQTGTCVYILSNRIIDRRKIPENFISLPFGLTKFLKTFEIAGRQIENPNILNSLQGSSIQIKEVRQQLLYAAACTDNVLITGETGTGKSLAAMIIHELSSRHNKKIVVENIASIPPGLIESELFGVEKGAYTDSKNERRGLILSADKSTLFLDEIGELDYSLQSKLLLAVQDGLIRKIGSDKNLKIDVRFIFATNQDLKEKIQNKEFRKDLYYRINEMSVYIPPLRERKDDIEEIALNFLENQDTQITITKSAIETLKNYSWPGNVRELQNVLLKASRKCKNKIITPAMLDFS